MGKSNADNSITDPILNTNKTKLFNKKVNKINRHLKIGTWNICRGLITREQELQQLMKREELDNTTVKKNVLIIKSGVCEIKN